MNSVKRNLHPEHLESSLLKNGHDEHSESSLNEFRVEGLSCANCARELQEDIRRLPHGESAALHFNSQRLKVSPHIDLERVQKILRSDGASLVLPSPGGDAMAIGHEEHGHSHEHEHEHGHDQHNGHEHGHEHGQGHSHEHSHGAGGQWILRLLITAAVLFGTVLLLGSLLPETLQIVLYLAAIALSGYSTFLRGLRNLTRLRFNMDTLMTVALTGAVLIGEWKEATLVALLFGLNELLEDYGMDRARRSMEALLDAAPKQAVLVRGDETITIPAAKLQAGDLVLVRPGEQIPSDGIIEEGHSAVNEAAITGESVPASKKPGDAVFGGSLNSDGLLRIKITKAYEDSSLAKIMHLVREAQDTKTPTELFIDKFAKYYTPAIMVIAVLVTIIPPLLLGASWMKWLYEGLAILIVGCPCSLVLSSPIALVSGMARSAKLGVLVKGGVHLEQLGKVNAIAFDKTGTLTEGRPAVLREVVYDDARFHKVAAAVEAPSLHPLAQAIVRHIAGEAGAAPASPPAQPAALLTLPGQGVRAELGGTTYWVGNEDLLTEVQWTPDSAEAARVAADLKSLKDDGLTVVAVADGNGVLGLFGLADQLRPESPEVIAHLHQAGIAHTVMLTGDHEGTAKAIAERTGVTDWYAGLLPAQKVERIRELSQQWTVAMVGDGINDAPALAQAQLGIAMGKGTDSAVETADIVLMQDHLGKLPSAIAIARQASRVIRWNIGISLSLKIFALLLTIPGLLTLWIAVLADMGATIIVTLLGLSVLLGKDKYSSAPELTTKQ